MVLALVLEVARELRAVGKNPMVVVTTSDTLVESPEIANHIDSESRKIMAYGRRHGLNVSFYKARPGLMASWQIKVLSGRGLPSYAGQQSDCSVDLKITPQRVPSQQAVCCVAQARVARAIYLSGNTIFGV